MLHRSILAAAVFLVAVGCGGEDSSGGTPPAPEPTSTLAPTTSVTATTATTAISTTVPTTAATTSTAPPTTAAPTSTVACRSVPEFPVPFGEPDPAMAVRRGDCGPGVRQIQELLVGRGFTIAVDGQFGPGTEAAVRELQASVGLAADGIVGPMTWVALNSDDFDPSEA